MIQEILTWVTVTAAILYTVYSFGKMIFSNDPQGLSCGGGCPHCEAKSLLIKEIKTANHFSNPQKKALLHLRQIGQDSETSSFN